MRLLVTRPRPDADATAARLRALGHEPVVAPMLALEILPPPGRPEPAAILLTSANALRALERWPAAVGWRHLPVFAVGDATADAARAAGFTAVFSAGGDAAALAGLVRARLSPAAGELLYPAAEERAGRLEERLAGHGFRVATVVAYRMLAIPALPDAARAALAERRLDGVLLYSRRSAAVFRDRVGSAGLDAAMAGVAVFALSAAVAAALEGWGPAPRIAAGPNEDDLLALIPETRGTTPAV